MQKYEPPEGVYGGKLKKRTEKWSADVWGLGCLIWEIFNGLLPKSSSLKSVGKIPSNLLSHYGELVSANPKGRPDPAKFITQCRAKGQYLANSFVDSNLFLAEIQVQYYKYNSFILNCRRIRMFSSKRFTSYIKHSRN
jgi:SCY1-like protein 1